MPVADQGSRLLLLHALYWLPGVCQHHKDQHFSRYMDELYCEPGTCQIAKPRPPGYDGPKYHFRNCIAVIDDIAYAEHPLPLGEQHPSENRKRFRSMGYHTRNCSQVRGEKTGTVADLWEAGSLSKAASVMVHNGIQHRGHDGSAPPMELQYFAIRGLAELPRLILEESGTPYIGLYYGREDFNTYVKPTLPHGRMPVLRNFDKKRDLVLAQSAAIVRYLASHTGLDGAGSDAGDMAQVDMWFQTHQELFESHATWGKSFSPRALKEAAGKPISFKDTANSQSYTLYQTSLAALNTFEEQLITSNSTYLLGPKLTYVDLALWSTLVELEEDDNFPGALDALGLKSLAAFRRAVETRPNILAYLTSDRRLPRAVKEDGDYKYIPGLWTGKPSTERAEL